jgi:hypothetical protein
MYTEGGHCKYCILREDVNDRERARLKENRDHGFPGRNSLIDSLRKFLVD